MYTFKTDKIKKDINSWLPPEEIDAGTYEQLANLSENQWVDKIALMPDAHSGFGVPIGTVFTSTSIVIPSAVGVDIGCGITCINTGIHFDQEAMGDVFWQLWAARVQKAVPTGFSWFETDQSASVFEDKGQPLLKAKPLNEIIKDRAMKQFGTLGGGNHFLEAQVDESGCIWFMVHSGSRFIGGKIAEWYSNIAKQRSTAVPQKKDLEHLWLSMTEGQDYISDMQWAIKYARLSRQTMLHNLTTMFVETCEDYLLNVDTHVLEAGGAVFIDRCHNEAVSVGGSKMQHNKGAMRLKAGELGPIPGSMGAPSFIVKGLGNEDALSSTSHGAGRRMSRGQAKREISLDSFSASLTGTFNESVQNLLDEAPGAYKDINRVIALQAELCTPVHVLLPLKTVKGNPKAKDD